MRARKDEKRDDEEDRRALKLWQSIDTWADHPPGWEKKVEAYRNTWEVKSFTSSEGDITGRPVFPKKKYLGKTPRRWCEVFLFYLIFYSVLFWVTVALFYFVKYVILPTDRPLYLDIIDKQTGVTVLPQMNDADSKKNCDIALEYIEFNSSVGKETSKFFSRYQQKAGGVVACSFDTKRPEGKSCKFDVKQLGPCGAPFTNPCVIFRLTRTIDWVPKGLTSVEDLPQNFPGELKVLLESLPEKERDRVWLHCSGKKHENLKGEAKSFNYYPSHSSFPAYYFPFTRQPDFQDPLVAVQIEMDPNNKVLVTCRTWDKSTDPTDLAESSISFLFFTS